MELGIRGKVAIVTGAGGALCGEIAVHLAREGALVAVCDICRQAAVAKVEEIRASGGSAMAVACDVTDRDCMGAALDSILTEYGKVDILINGAGGSHKATTTCPDLEFFDIDSVSLEEALSLNYVSVVVPSQVVGRIFAKQGSGVVLNISSIAGISPLTRALGYSSGKAAANNFTQWLAVHMAQSYSPRIRVNAIAPGFMLTAQNRFLLIDGQTGSMTPRGQQIISSVPMGRYGEPDEVVGAALWLVSNAASFVTGVVIPVDGGFTAFSGV